jgi:hypothetical protein
MAQAADLARIHERIDETHQLLSRLSAVIETNVELCKQCRPKVLGNGKEGFETRLARLEEVQIYRGETRLTTLETKFAVSKTFLALTISAAGAVGSIAAAIIRYLAGG